MIKRVDLLSLELTNACNLSCPFCASPFMKRKKGFMDKELAKRLIKEARDAKFCDRLVTSVMGEPLLCKDLFEILRYAKELGQKIGVITNGERLDEKAAQELLACEPSEVAISLHADSEASFADRGAKICYEEYKKRIFNLIDLKYRLNAPTHISVQVLSTIKQGHHRLKVLSDLDSIEHFSAEWLIFAQELKERHRIKWRIPNSLFVGCNGLLPECDLALYDSSHRWSNTILPPQTSVRNAKTCHCTTPFTQCNVLWNGDMTLCCIDYDGELVFDNVVNKGLLESFNSAKAQDIRRGFIDGRKVPDKCLKCWGTVLNPDRTAFDSRKQEALPVSARSLLTKSFYRCYALFRNHEMLGYVRGRFRERSISRKMKSGRLEA